MNIWNLRSVPSGRVLALVERYQAVVACAIALGFLVAFHRAYNVTGLHFDSAQYWLLASIENLGRAHSGRGYVFPALLAPLNYFTTYADLPAHVYRTGMALIYAVLLTIFVPAAFRQAFGGKLTVVRRLVPVLLMAILFPGLLLFTLSDLPAFLMALGALMCALRGLQGTQTRQSFQAMMLSSGILIGAAYNTRTIYLFAAVPLTLMVLVMPAGPWRSFFPRWHGLIAFAMGIFLISFPQFAINQRTHGVSSMAVQSLINNKGLFPTQLAWGMTLQRYETTVSADAPGAQVYYFDPAGAKLFNSVSSKGDLFSVPYYLKVVAQHPLDFLALYTRHVVNGLDVRDGLVYTLKPSPRRNSTALFNFIVLALAVAVVVSLRTPVETSNGGDVRAVPRSWPLSLGLLLLPVAAIVPGAVETRFFLPLHLLAYCVIAFHFDRRRLLQCLRMHGRTMLLVLLVAAGAFFAMSLNTMANLQYIWPDVYRIGP